MMFLNMLICACLLMGVTFYCHKLTAAIAQPVTLQQEVEITNDATLLGRYKHIMNRMASWYGERGFTSDEGIEQDVINDNMRFFYYKDPLTEIVIAFQPKSKMWKVSRFGLISSDLKHSEEVTIRIVRNFLISQGEKRCYAIVPNSMNDMDIKLFYENFKFSDIVDRIESKEDFEIWNMAIS